MVLFLECGKYINMCKVKWLRVLTNSTYYLFVLYNQEAFLVLETLRANNY